MFQHNFKKDIQCLPCIIWPPLDIQIKCNKQIHTSAITKWDPTFYLQSGLDCQRNVLTLVSLTDVGFYFPFKMQLLYMNDYLNLQFTSLLLRTLIPTTADGEIQAYTKKIKHMILSAVLSQRITIFSFKGWGKSKIKW